ncbi:PREDICTED: tripartite motif-containing protein 14 [Nanorana parkeri]|uniref:tripartite motif-containing protein 14 n=1 Tax=Nanorana parkeri TaxID=125878 RepID=UPI0008540927|nr:PREDICTED: tripartite motif-containing protein 14 [Nanorana parkeri]
MNQQHGNHLTYDGYQVPATAASALWQPPLLELCGLCGAGCPVPVCLASCGHRFCLGCLEGFWQQLPNCEKPCPTCSLPRESQASQRQRPLQCNVCPAHQPCIARWSCLTCGESYCPEHFQPHMLEEESGGVALAGHRVCDAAGEEARRMRSVTRRCIEHRDRPVEMYCSKCRVCICTLCPLLGIHKGHPVTLIQQEAMHKKNLMNRCLEQLDQKRIHVLGNIQNIEQAGTELKDHTLASKDSMTANFTELRLLLDEEETLAKKYIDDKTKMVLWAYESQMEHCQNQIKAIDKISTKVRGIHLQPDTIQLIQDYAASENEIRASMAPAEQWHPVPFTFDHLENYYGSFMETLKSSFTEPLVSRLQKETFSGIGGRATEKPGMLIKTKSFVHRSLLLKHARCPTLDPNTMHPKLRLSEDLLTVNGAWFGKFNSSHPPRFDKLMQILSRDSYFSGTHYWEVDVLQAVQGWWIGITYPSIQRKGDSELSRLGWTSGSWCIKRFDCEYWAFHKGERKAIHLNTPPEKIGVFLDYESGVLSFFDVRAGMRHLHTFRCRFTEPLYPALRLWDGSITICRLT